MNLKYTRWLAVAALALTGVTPMASIGADAPASDPVVSQLQAAAVKAITAGRFDAANQILTAAVKVSKDDPRSTQMLKWSDAFRDQLKVFSGERHVAYEKAVADVKMMSDKGHPDYALDFADRAELLSDDKKAFPNQPWVRTLINDAVTHAAQYEKDGNWYRAMRLYRDLAAVEPASKDWKEKLKDVTRRVRLVALYAPDVYKGTLDGETKERDEVEALVSPTTQPTTKPAEIVENENFKIDWHDTLKGVQMSMLTTALADADAEYYRDIDYKLLASGGLMGIDAVANTKGLEKAFPALADTAKKAEFQAALDRWKTQVREANADTQESVIDNILGDGPDGLLAVSARTVQIPDQVLISEFADGAFAGLDPFTSMIWPSEVAEFTKATQGEFSGIGIQIEAEDSGDLRVVRPLTDSPAEVAGIKSGDVIAKINGKSARGITSDQAVKGITGPSGTVVNITIRTPDGTLEDMNIRRARIRVESVEGYTRKSHGKWDYYVDPDNKIAYMRITSFSGSTRDELAAALKSLGSDVNGVIVDLRGNPGGLLTAATGVCDQFLEKGVIVSTHPDRDTKNPPTMSRAENDHARFLGMGRDLPVCDKPLVVLVNQYSASASEIVSGCLKDDHRAILVGERTFGKGSVQQIFQLDNNCIVKLTTAHYYLPSGRCIHREENSTEWGVDPDVTVEMTPEQMRAAMIARQDMEMARDVNAAPAEGMQSKLNDMAKPGPANGEAVKPESATTRPTSATTQPVHKTLLEADPQLSAALLVLRLEVTGHAG
jgi:carboxyl-terminal processing protease